MSNLNPESHAYICPRRHGKMYRQTITKQYVLSQNNGTKKKRLMLEEKYTWLLGICEYKTKHPENIEITHLLLNKNLTMF